MVTLIKNIEVYAPEYLGKQDLLISNTIEEISDEININGINIIDGSEYYAFPGFIDSHVHILGGGGEGGFSTRTPELKISDMITAGVTTVVGCLGTDGICRDMKSLIAKAKGIKEYGLSAYIYTGSYRLPLKTLTGSVMEDIMLIEEVIGVGEIAISDHRGSNPTFDEFTRVVADARTAGMLSGKSGIVNIHVGSGKDGLKYVFDMIEKTDIPATQVMPTHMARNERLVEEAILLCNKGGQVDFTTSTSSVPSKDDDLACSKVLKRLLNEGISPDRISFSSDGQGSLPKFNASGEYIGMGIGTCKSLYDTAKECIIEEGIEIEKALKPITSSPATALKLKNKGRVEKGKDADLVLVDKHTLEIDTVICNGNLLMKNKKSIVKDKF